LTKLYPHTRGASFFETQCTCIGLDESLQHYSHASVVSHNYCTQDAYLSQRDRAIQGALVLAKSGRLELGDNILRSL